MSPGGSCFICAQSDRSGFRMFSDTLFQAISYLQTTSLAAIPRESSRWFTPTRDELSRVEVGPLLKRMILIDYLQQRSAGQLVGVIDRRLWKMTIFVPDISVLMVAKW